MHGEAILSVGIDVGTTSTHLSVSRLRLANVSRLLEPTRLVIEEAQLIYRSPIYFTPLTKDGHIDADKVSTILRDEYAKAGIKPIDVDTGAVIITGESAAKRNASQVGRLLAELAGHFVVASAGPNLESILAGRGSGAAAASKAKQSTICNVDIGGGTTNIAAFKNGSLLVAQCLVVGGRFIRLDESWQILELTDAGQEICRQATGKDWQAGEIIGREQARAVAEHAAKTILDCVEKQSCDEYWFSGGVAEVMRDPGHDCRSEVEYGDLGIVLGRALLQLLHKRGTKFKISADPMRATVIGAGTHSLQLSGSTVSVSPGMLPITNLPVVRANGDIEQALRNYDLKWSDQPLALYLPELGRMNYAELHACANMLSASFRNQKGCAPLVIICSHDIAAALGQVLKKMLGPTPHIVLDGINSWCGDFIDIGQPLANNQAIPVVLKELVFASTTSAKSCAIPPGDR
ncbi:MAG TPA: ethanolamine ammonia-lyase reactivating factor EutA [Candidatus Obscuribacterales bacterium]